MTIVSIVVDLPKICPTNTHTHTHSNNFGIDCHYIFSTLDSEKVAK